MPDEGRKFQTWPNSIQTNLGFYLDEELNFNKH